MQANVIHYATAWYEALKTAKSGQQPEISQRMLKMLQMKGKLSWLSRIVEQVQELEDAADGIVNVKVSSADKLKAKEIEPIIAELTDGANTRLTVTEDKELLGGMVVRTSDKRWDISMKKQINELKDFLNS